MVSLLLGIVRVYDLDELIETAELLSTSTPLPSASPAIVSYFRAGAAASWPTWPRALGWCSSPSRQAISQRLRAILPPFATINNPLDPNRRHRRRPDAAAARASGPGRRSWSARSRWRSTRRSAPTSPTPSALPGYVFGAVAERRAASDKPHIIFSMSSGHYDPEVIAIARAPACRCSRGMRGSLAAIARARHSGRFCDQARCAPPRMIPVPDMAEAVKIMRCSNTTTLGEQAGQGGAGGPRRHRHHARAAGRQRPRKPCRPPSSWATRSCSRSARPTSCTKPRPTPSGSILAAQPRSPMLSEQILDSAPPLCARRADRRRAGAGDAARRGRDAGGRREPRRDRPYDQLWARRHLCRGAPGLGHARRAAGARRGRRADR